MNRSFTIASRFHPAYSLLGRWIRRRSADSRAAESTYIVAAATLAVGLIVSQFLAWAHLYPMSPSALTTFLSVQFVIAAAYAAGALVGRQPARHVHVTDDGLRIERGDEPLFVSFLELPRVSIISAEIYYGHYARYADTLRFVNRVYARLLMLEIRGRPVILGLETADLLELEQILAERIEPTEASYASPRVGAA